MAKSIQVAEVFAAIGVRASTKELDSFIRGMNEAVKAVKELRVKTKAAFTVKTNYQDLRVLRNTLKNTSTEVVNLRAKLASLGKMNVNARATGTIRTRNMGGAGGGGGGGHPGGTDYFGRGTAGGDIAAAMRFGGAGAVARQFLPGFGGAFLGMNMFQVSNQYDAMLNGLSAVTGGVDQARQHMSWLRAEADRVGFSFLDNGRQFTNLAAAGFSVGFTMEQTKELFIGTAEAGRVLGLSTDDMAGALRAIQQMMSKGTISAEELKGQLGERLPGAVGLAAKAMGKTVPELFKMMEAGELLAKDFLPKFSVALREFAGSNNALARATATPAAQFERLKNAWNAAMNAFGKSGPMEVVSELMSGMADSLEVITPGLEKLGKGMKVVAAAAKVVINPLTLTVALIAGIGYAASVSIIPVGLLFGLLIVKAALVTAAMLPMAAVVSLVVASLMMFSEIWDHIHGKDTLIGRSRIGELIAYGSIVQWVAKRIEDAVFWMKALRDAAATAGEVLAIPFKAAADAVARDSVRGIYAPGAPTTMAPSAAAGKPVTVTNSPTITVNVTGTAGSTQAQEIADVVLSEWSKLMVGAEAAVGAN